MVLIFVSLSAWMAVLGCCAPSLHSLAAFPLRARPPLPVQGLERFDGVSLAHVGVGSTENAHAVAADPS